MCYIDSFGIFDSSEAFPFMLLDGHGSRFGEDFLKYVNYPTTKWVVCIGVPYGTNLCQVADRKEQNLSFKFYVKVSKSAVIQKKVELHLPLHVELHDIAGIEHRAFHKSFGKVQTNKQAMADSGWNPLTYVLLDHKELKKEKRSTTIDQAIENCTISGQQPISSLNDVNLSTGISATLLDKIVDNLNLERAPNTALEDQREEIRRQKVATFNESIWITAGV